MFGNLQALINISPEHFKDTTPEELLKRATKIHKLLSEEADRLDEGIEVDDQDYVSVRFDMLTVLISEVDWFMERCVDENTKKVMDEWDFRVKEMGRVLGEVIRKKAN